MQFEYAVIFLQVLSGKKKMELLPGDRENLAIQTRGGPQKYEVTGWVLVSSYYRPSWFTNTRGSSKLMVQVSSCTNPRLPQQMRSCFSLSWHLGLWRQGLIV